MSLKKNLFFLMTLSFIGLSADLLEIPDLELSGIQLPDLKQSLDINNREEVSDESITIPKKLNKTIINSSDNPLKKEVSEKLTDDLLKEEEIINIYSRPKEVSSEWKSSISEQFYKDIAVIKQVVLDGEKDLDARDKFLKSFRNQQDWFDEAVSSVHSIEDLSYEEIKEKRFFIGRIANAQRRSDVLLLNFSKNLELNSFVKKKVRLDILADINTYVLEEMKRGLKPSKESFLSDKAVLNIVNENLKEFTKQTLIGRGINPSILNSINLNMGRLITKEDYQGFSTQLRKNINGELKVVFSTIEKRLEEQNKKNKAEVSKNYKDLLNTLDGKLSSTEARLQVYIDRKMDEFSRKLDLITKRDREKQGIIDLDVIENRMKNYFDGKLKGIEDKINATKNSIDETQGIVNDTKESINAVNNTSEIVDNKQIKSIFNISKRNIDKKIYDEVGKQLSALKEDRLKKFEKLSRNRKKAERRKLLRNLLEKELGKNFS